MAEVQQLMKRVMAHKKAAARKKEAVIIQAHLLCCLTDDGHNMLLHIAVLRLHLVASGSTCKCRG